MFIGIVYVVHTVGERPSSAFLGHLVALSTECRPITDRQLCVTRASFRSFQYVDQSLPLHSKIIRLYFILSFKSNNRHVTLG